MRHALHRDFEDTLVQATPVEETRDRSCGGRGARCVSDRTATTLQRRAVHGHSP